MPFYAGVTQAELANLATNLELQQVGSLASPVVVDPSVGVQPEPVKRQVWWITSPGSGLAVTANPQIAPGVLPNQELYLVGTDPVNFLTFADGNGLSLNGEINVDDQETLYLIWDGNVWNEISRRR